MCGDNPVRRLGQGVDGFGQGFPDGSRIVARIFPLGLGERSVQGPHVGYQGLGGNAVLAGHLAADQVHGLDAVGAFVNGGDADVAEELRRP